MTILQNIAFRHVVIRRLQNRPDTHRRNVWYASALLLATALVISAGASGERRLIKSGSKWEDLAAYSRAVVEGDWIFVSGTVGFNPKDSSISPDFDKQMDQIFHNISWALEQADAELADIVRVRCYLVDAAYVEAMSRKLHQYLGNVQPTNTTVITGLAAAGALIEVEVTAYRRD